MANFDIGRLNLTHYDYQYNSGRPTSVLGKDSTQFEANEIEDGYAAFNKPILPFTSAPQNDIVGDPDSLMKELADLLSQMMAMLQSFIQQFLSRSGQDPDDTGDIADAFFPSNILTSTGEETPPFETPVAVNAAATPEFPTGTADDTGSAQTVAFDPNTMIDVTQYGVSKDSADNTAAFNAAFAAAKREGKTAYIPEGTFNHSGVLIADGVNVTGAGKGTVLRATNPDASAIKLTGDNGSISNLSVEATAPNRSSMPDAAGILVQNANGATVSNVIVRGAASNGIRLDGATNCTITHVLVTGTNADGIALMNGSSNNRVLNCVVDQAGDDAFSDDSYAGDARQDSGNVFQNCLARNNSYGRGFALMGSANDTIDHCYSFNTPGHGVAAGTDYNSGTMTGSGHIIKNSFFIGAKDSPIAADGMYLENNQTTGDVPNIVSILGFDPGPLADRYSYNPGYVPGTGPGANNTPGNRT